MKHTTPISRPAIIPVFLKRKSAVIKHFKRTSEPRAVTLCDTAITLEAQPSGLARECLECQRLKAQADAARRAELEKLSPISK